MKFQLCNLSRINMGINYYLQFDFETSARTYILIMKIMLNYSIV